jgi:surface protein
MSGMFYNATSFNSPLNGWGSTTSKVTDMSSMFYGASSFNQPLDNWKISSVKSTASMFAFASNFNSSLNGWGSTTGNVQDMSFMFEWDTAFNQPLDNWDVSSVTNMGYMFYGAYKFNSPLNNWGSKTGNVTDMSEMFFNDTSFNQPINSWDVSSVANMSYMFYTAYRFNQPLNNWKVSKVVSMPYMFGSATAFNQSLGNWNLSSINDMTSMLDYSGLDCISYANTLYGWASNLGNTTPSGAIPFGAAGHKHSSADSIVAAYNALSAAGWIINDNGEGTCVIITPVTLLNFTAEAQANNTALLQWATVTEANNKGFDVQRSTDGASWIDLAFVNSQAPGGNSSLQLHYQYTDNSPFAGNNYYRLKQVDLSGTATYSAVRELSFNNLATLQASPNPASGEVRVTLPAGAGNNVPYKLTGTNGSVILSGTMSNISGYGRISVSNVASGLYFLQIMTNNVVQTCKLQVAH